MNSLLQTLLHKRHLTFAGQAAFSFRCPRPVRTLGPSSPNRILQRRQKFSVCFLDNFIPPTLLLWRNLRQTRAQGLHLLSSLPKIFSTSPSHHQESFRIQKRIVRLSIKYSQCSRRYRSLISTLISTLFLLPIFPFLRSPRRLVLILLSSHPT